MIWRVAPLSFERIASVEENAIADFSASLLMLYNQNGIACSDAYQITHAESQEEMLQDILNLLNESKYRQDFRNLLPWQGDSFSGGKSYNGTVVMLTFSVSSDEDQYILLDFLSPNKILVSVNDAWYIYHPANRDTLEKIAHFVRSYGVKQ